MGTDTSAPAREFDVVLFGVTGFTGRQTAAYFRSHAPEGLRWAIAARSADKLAAVGESVPGVPRIVADSADSAAMHALAGRARVVLTTVGPYARYGDPLAAACVARGTDYVDITGETPWVRSLIDRWHGVAAAAGTRIVPCCGFDSVPSDMGAWLVADWIRREWGQPTVKVLGAVSMRGGYNGGTLRTVLELPETGLKGLTDPVLLNPDPHRTRAEREANPDWRAVVWSEELGRWLAPALMAAANTRVVRRSAALLADWGEGYARPSLLPFRYQEVTETRSRLRGYGVALGLAAGFGVLRSRAGRAIVRRLGRAPGEGPSEADMDGGFFRMRLLAEAADGRKALGTFADVGDPGNRGTVKMLCEAALTLATTPRDALPGGAPRGGVLTPATALGAPYAARLRAAGMTLSVVPFAGPPAEG